MPAPQGGRYFVCGRQPRAAGITSRMREILRKGPPVNNLGRHGKVATGQTVFVSELEFLTVRYSPDWEEVPGGVRTVAEAAPVETRNYNLGKIDWHSPGLVKKLRKLGRKQLKKVALGMRELGMVLPTGPPDNDEQVFDGIVEMAHRHGWTGEVI